MKYTVTYAITHNKRKIISTSTFEATDKEDAEFVLMQLFSYKSLKIIKLVLDNN